MRLPGQFHAFRLINGVALRGGFAGFGEPDPDARDVLLYATILDGDLNGDDGPNFANAVENCYHVVTSIGTTDTAVLDGFTIRGGYADHCCDYRLRRGAGLMNEEGSPTLVDCTFADNFADDDGGGMYHAAGRPSLTRCTFRDNVARLNNGAGLFSEARRPTLLECTFLDNDADFAGGGFYSAEGWPTVTGCIFERNHAYLGGGICVYGGEALVTDCTLVQNSAGYGGALYVDLGKSKITDCTLARNSAGNGGAASLAGSPVLTRCDILDNTAGGYGGGVENSFGSRATFISCTFRGNSADSGGGAMNGRRCEPIYVNCLFENNHADIGGGMYDNGKNCRPTLRNCTIVDNHATTRAGGIRSASNAFNWLTNCILWGNTDPDGQDQWAQLDYAYGIRFSNIQGCDTYCRDPNWRNSGADPVFADPGQGDYHLSPGSPCIDSGNNGYVPEDVITDLDGNLRFVDDPDTEDNGLGDPPIVDRGVYEFPSVSYCDAINKLKVTCKASAFKVKATILTGLPEGTEVTLTLDGDRPKTAAVDADGKVVLRWSGVAEGEHEVCVTGCGLCETVTCGG